MVRSFICCALSAVLFGICPLFSKMLSMGGMSASNITFYLYFFNMLISLGCCLIKKETLKVNKSQIFSMFVVGMAGVGMTAFLLAESYILIPIGSAMTIHYLYPTLVMVFMVTIHKDKFTYTKAVAVVLSIVGMAYMTGNSGGGQPLGYLYAVASALCFGLYLVASQISPYASLNSIVRLVYISASVCIGFAIIAMIGDGLQIRLDISMLIYVLGMSICSASAHILLAYGVIHIGAVAVAFTSMLEPVASVLIGWLFLHEHLTGKTCVGIFLILAAVFVINADKAVNAKK